MNEKKRGNYYITFETEKTGQMNDDDDDDWGHFGNLNDKEKFPCYYEKTNFNRFFSYLSLIHR